MQKRKILNCVKRYVINDGIDESLIQIYEFKNLRNNTKYYIMADYTDETELLNKYTKKGTLIGYNSIEECKNVIRRKCIV